MDNMFIYNISIIVPIYNVELYLEKCLDSLVTQSLESIEIIAVNDGSTDSSPKILDKYSKKYPNIIKAFHKTNGGLSDARNYGIEKATGEYIGFVDSDDWIAPDMCEEMYKMATTKTNEIIVNNITYIIPKKLKPTTLKKYIFDNHHLYNWITSEIFQKKINSALEKSDIVVCGGIKHFQSKNDITISSRPIKIRGRIDDFGNSVTEKPHILFAAHSLACNKIFAHHLFENDKYKFPKGQWFEDSALIYSLLFEANKVSCVNKPFYHYRFNRVGSITSSISPKIFDIFKSCNNILNSYHKYKFTNPALEGIIEKIIRNHILVRIDTLIHKSSAEDKKLALSYTKEAFSYLDKNFYGWKTRYMPPKNKKFSLKWHARKSKIIIYIYLFSPNWVKGFVKNIINFKTNISSKRKRRKNNNQQKKLQLHGYPLLIKLDKIFNNLSIKYFVDFGTLLGFVRDNRFMLHDLDLDLGVIATEEDKLNLYAALQKSGYSLFRSYILNNKIVEQSYHYLDEKKKILVKFDINFYETTENGSKTWLFYYIKKSKLKARYRHVVEMTYSKITEIDYLKIQGHNIPIPKNYAQILEEKYGKSWSIPDMNWVYWKSPAAKKLDELGYYITKYEMPASKIRLLQIEQLKVLNNLEEVLTKHNLQYYLAEGTLLGAIRHKGYIPWDDDIDISMPREDYDKLLALSEHELPNEIRIWAHTTDPNYHLPFAKVVTSDKTNFRNTFPKNIQKKFSGPRIDIFPLDSLKYSTDKQNNKIAKKIRLLRTAMLIKAKYSVNKTNKNKLLSLIIPFVSMQFLQKKIYTLATLNNNKDNKFFINWFSAYSHSKQTIHIDAYKPILHVYENKLRPIPKEYDFILTKIYGKYMMPPPLNKRKNASHFMIYDANKS